jgi:hypothetical protein
MKIKSGFILRKCGEADIVVPIGQNVEKYKNVMITLSGTSRMLWDALVKGCDEEALVTLLLTTFEDAPEAVVRADVANFVKTLKKAELLDD